MYDKLIERQIAADNLKAVEREVAGFAARNPMKDLPADLSARYDAARNEYAFAKREYRSARKEWLSTPHGISTQTFAVAKSLGLVSEDGQKQVDAADRRVKDTLGRIRKLKAEGKEIPKELSEERSEAMNNYHDTVQACTMMLNAKTAEFMNRNPNRYNLDGKLKMPDKVSASNLEDRIAISEYASQARVYGETKQPEVAARTALNLLSVATERKARMGLLHEPDIQFYNEDMDSCDTNPPQDSPEKIATLRRQTSIDGGHIYADAPQTQTRGKKAAKDKKVSDNPESIDHDNDEIKDTLDFLRTIDPSELEMEMA